LPSISFLSSKPGFPKRYFGDCLRSEFNGRQGKKKGNKTRDYSTQATDQSEPPLRAEFAVETLLAIDELDSGIGKTFSSKKAFLDDLDRL
jgi:hypothetical protein